MNKKGIELLKIDLNGKIFYLSKWKPPKDNLRWSHDHCEICNIEISDKINNESYTNENNFYWICKICFKKYSKELGLKIK